MNINYNVNHRLFEHEILKDLKNKPRIITWLVWSQIMWLAYHTKNQTCQFRQGDFSRDLGIGQGTTRQALDYLVEKGMIKCVFPYQSKTMTPAVYALTTACIRIMQNLYQKSTKPVSGPDTVNNIKKILKGDNDSFNKNQSPKKKSRAINSLAHLNKKID